MKLAQSNWPIPVHGTVPNPQLEQLLQLQRDALEMVADGRPTGVILDQLCLLSEAMVPRSVASIMLLDADERHLTVRAAPNMPREGIDALNGLEPGPHAGSCGTAVFHQRAEYVDNIQEDERWTGYRDIAQRFDMAACWSTPIRTAGGKVVGSFALTSFERRLPGPFHKRLLDNAGYLAGIVLEREQQLQRLHTAAIAFEHMREAVMVADADGRIVQVNRAFEHITGYPAAEAIGQNPRMLNSGHQGTDFYLAFYRALEENREWRGEIWNRRKNGDVYPQWLSVRAVHDEQGELSQYVSVFADISDSKDYAHKLWRLAHHDALSNLPNRLLLNVRLEHAIQRAQRISGKLALLFIDLDRFKNINDSMGHQAGDELLCQIANRLQAAVHADDTVARLGGDEFVVLLDDIPDENAARRIAERIVKQLSKPVTVQGRTLFATASIGISLYPQDAREAETLLQHADTAMYRAKAAGRNRFAFYAPELTRIVQRRMDIEQELRRALRKQELSLHFQPQFAATDGRLVAVEALLRWDHPEHGSVPPDEFIPIAEETGLIHELGCWVTRTACEQMMRWQKLSPQRFTLAVNLSPHQLRGDCAEKLGRIFEQTGMLPQWFEFEVTETLLVAEGGLAQEQLSQMRARHGMHITMDDFGTGPASLSQLKLLPISKLKIDRSFISGLPHSADDAAIVKAIILMAHTLGLQVVAVGVETPAQLEFLCRNGCDYLQGFLYGRPMPAEQLEALLAAGRLSLPKPHILRCD